MSPPAFPCKRVALSEPCVDPRALAITWIENRESDNWALISGTCLASDVHGWVAHEVLMRNKERGKMKSNSLDGEFIRLLSGTHHIATSFKRAGLCEGDETAWIVDLSCEQSDEMFTLHAEKMNFEIIDERPIIRFSILYPRNSKRPWVYARLAKCYSLAWKCWRGHNCRKAFTISTLTLPR